MTALSVDGLYYWDPISRIVKKDFRRLSSKEKKGETPDVAGGFV